MDELKDSKELESETGKADEKEERPEKESARTPVSYTHLDVYKRQIQYFAMTDNSAKRRGIATPAAERNSVFC